MRLFVAVDAPVPWRKAAIEAQRALSEALAEPGRRVLRPVDPALMHLTVRFLGEVDEGGVDALQAALDGHVHSFAIDLALTEPGTFGPAARTSVAWLGVGGDLQGLRDLAEHVEAAVRSAGLPLQQGELSPHLTLARIHRTATSEQRRAIAAAVRALAPPPPATTTVREVLLVRSHLSGGQPRYEVLSRHG